MSILMTAVALSWLLTNSAPVSGAPLTLEYIQGDVYSDSSGGSSLPARFNQHVVKDVPATMTLMRPTNVPALFAIVMVPYETVRDHLIPLIRQTLGEDSFHEEKHNDHVEWHEQYRDVVGTSGFHEKRRLEKEQSLTAAGIHWQSYREARIVTKAYNEVWWKRGRSAAMFRVIDGRDLFGRLCTVIQFTRTDYELRFGFLHNLPIPVFGMGDDPLVTDREVGLIERTAKEMGVSVTYFVANISSLSDNASRLLEIRDHCVSSTLHSSH